MRGRQWLSHIVEDSHVKQLEVPPVKRFRYVNVSNFRSSLILTVRYAASASRRTAEAGHSSYCRTTSLQQLHLASLLVFQNVTMSGSTTASYDRVIYRPLDFSKLHGIDTTGLDLLGPVGDRPQMTRYGCIHVHESLEWYMYKRKASINTVSQPVGVGSKHLC